MIKRFLLRTRRNKHGQSFIELMLVTLILALMLAAVVEFGFLMNNYLHVVDGAREAARVYNSSVAFDTNEAIVDNFYYQTALQAAVTMYPVMLDPALGDDIVVSVIGLRGTNIHRFPIENPQGWSLCSHYAAFKAYELNQTGLLPGELSSDGWNTCSGQTSMISDSDIAGRVGIYSQQAGMLMVEIFYAYPQVLKLPIFSHGEFFGTKFSIIPDPIPLYIYTIMPMSSAEPTAVH
jgi:hypothetical protein